MIRHPETALRGLQATKDLLETILIDHQKYLKRLKKERDSLQIIQKLIRLAQEKVQGKFKKRSGSMATSVIQSIYNKKMEFSLDIKERAGSIQYVPVIRKNGKLYGLKDEGGLGVRDTMGVIFRLVLWTLKGDKRTRPIFILDEPMKFLGGGILLSKAGRIFRKLSRRIPVQFVIMTHDKELIDIADRAFQTIHDGTRTTIKTIT